MTEIDLQNLHRSLGISANDFNNIRYEAIHLRCSNELVVKDVIDYFSGFDPKLVEMVDDESYNIVWNDPSIAAKALFFSSYVYEGIPVRASEEQMIGNVRLPPGCWLLGKGHLNLGSVLLRFSMRGDRKPRTTEVCSKYSRASTSSTSGSRTGPVDKKNPWGDLSKHWTERNEYSNRGQNRQNQNEKPRQFLRARRRN